MNDSQKEMITRWADGNLSPDESAEFEQLMESDAEFRIEAEAQLNVVKVLGEIYSQENVTMPHGDFFNTQITRRIELEESVKTPAHEIKFPWWRRLLLPAAFIGMATCFFLGMSLSSSDRFIEIDTNFAVVVYSPDEMVTAEVLEKADDSMVIVLSGLEEIPAALDLVQHSPSSTKSIVEKSISQTIVTATLSQ